MKFLFDLDGTITKIETLPLIARHFGVSCEIDQLTRETIEGNVPFIESFIRRVAILGELPVNEINELMVTLELFEGIVDFINTYPGDCVIVTGNLRGWISKLCLRLNCELYASDALIEGNCVKELTTILRKEEIVKKLQNQGESVVFIGDGNNDAEAMRHADISVASGLVHWPARAVLDVADYAVFDERALLRLLGQLRRSSPPPDTVSLVLSCAGRGSRLGLSTTKALIKFREKALIQWHLERTSEIEDVRVVVGFQARDVIESAQIVRKDVIYVFNHDYFSTGAGFSLFLGSKYANEFTIAWDGDLIVHHGDIERCLAFQGEFLGVSPRVTNDAVRAILDIDEALVTSFSRQGDYPFEWSGPSKFRTINIRDVSGHVFEGLNERLPLPALIVRAFDIDTPEDYEFAKRNARSYLDG